MVVLSLVCEEPMHPYRMQTLIRQRGKDLIANVAQRNSVYQTIVALRRAGFITVRETSREERRPERTVYDATEVGRQTLRNWIRHGLSNMAREFPEFPAVLSLLDPTLRPKELATLLETRAGALQARLGELEKAPAGLPRIFLLEEEYMAAVVRAELKWLRDVIADLRAGSVDFPSKAEMLRLAASMGGPSEEAIRRIEAERASTKNGIRKRPHGAETSKPKPGKRTHRSRR
jgi:DNA-binding PadR family transcriptional regulator